MSVGNVERIINKYADQIRSEHPRHAVPEKQEVVKLDFEHPTYSPSEAIASAACGSDMPVSDMSAMKLSIDKYTLSIPNGTDPHLLANP
ncbi:hypothetical protein [Robinsoniella peoriensis]